MSMFVDEVTIHLSSGAGGNGMVAWRREKFEPHGGPAGGDGGRGGDVVLRATRDLNTLQPFRFKKQFEAEPGENGKPKNKHGRAGKSLTIDVPCGTVVRDAETGEAIADLREEGDTVLVAEGGKGGRGNTHFTSSRRKAPHFAEPGEPGIQRDLKLELKLLADVGLLGFPNAGKSTLISSISAARPKIGNYPFTTLEPVLGVVNNPDDTSQQLVVADIPGLIEGASQGAGLGHAFLRHVERTRFLLHLIDLTPAELGGPQESPMTRWRKINEELRQYNEVLATRPQLIVLTKADMLTDPEQVDKAVEDFEAVSSHPVVAVSSVTHQHLTTLLQLMFQLAHSLPDNMASIEVVEDKKAFQHDDSTFEVVQEGEDEWRVIGGKVERWMNNTNPRNRQAVFQMIKIFDAMGIFDALAKAGAIEGDTIRIGNQHFEFSPEMTKEGQV